ncbi:hypothetical protein [Streptomyces spinosirectus]
MTTIEKIVARKAGIEGDRPGQTVVCDVGMTVVIDLQSATGWVQPPSMAGGCRAAQDGCTASTQERTPPPACSPIGPSCSRRLPAPRLTSIPDLPLETRS